MKSAAIENDLVDILRQQTLGDQLSDLLRRGAIGRAFSFAAECLLRSWPAETSVLPASSSMTWA